MATIERRKTKHGRTRYRVKIRINRNGKNVHSESRSFSKLSVAKSWARSREEQLERPGELERVKHDGVSIRSLIQRYLDETVAIKPPGRSKGAALKALLKEDVAEHNALTLTQRQLLEHLSARRRAGAGASTVQNDIAWLRVVMRYAKRVWGVPIDLDVIEEAAETARETGLVSRPRRRARRPSADELRRLEAYFQAKRRSRIPMDLVMWLAIYSARRQDELCRLRIEDFNRDEGTYWVRDVKHPDGSAGNDKLARLPEPGWRVVDAIMARGIPAEGLLLPFNSKTIGTYWRNACKLLGITDLRFHDLRHEACSRLAEDGATIPEIQQVSLHDSWSSLQRYVQVLRQTRYDYGD